MFLTYIHHHWTYPRCPKIVVSRSLQSSPVEIECYTDGSSYTWQYRPYIANVQTGLGYEPSLFQLLSTEPSCYFLGIKYSIFATRPCRQHILYQVHLKLIFSGHTMLRTFLWMLQFCPKKSQSSNILVVYFEWDHGSWAELVFGKLCMRSKAAE